MTWFFNQKPVNDIPINPDTDKPYFAFVYLITDPTEKMYVGKKLFWRKNKARAKKLNPKPPYSGYIESDWKTYYGSSPILNKAIEEQGKQEFLREILHFCNTKSQAGYLETHEQFSRAVLLKPDQYYNDWISARITRRHLEKQIMMLTEQLNVGD